ncbi:hypothetical protein BDA96_03G243000 [Sorghum bicolor]|uniref:Uncharacterized protein n=1 Tax=Sorghum bicolor TaxID=4558 RepID=A0A921RER3_SORBI|nr:hypothetical protein BDA96_03G243000 [Sorghum bicolor]
MAGSARDRPRMGQRGPLGGGVAASSARCRTAAPSPPVPSRSRGDSLLVHLDDDNEIDYGGL